MRRLMFPAFLGFGLLMTSAMSAPASALTPGDLAKAGVAANSGMLVPVHTPHGSRAHSHVRRHYAPPPAHWRAHPPAPRHPHGWHPGGPRHTPHWGWR